MDRKPNHALLARTDGSKPSGLEALEGRLLLSASWVDPAVQPGGDPLTADDVVIEAGIEPVYAAAESGTSGISYEPLAAVQPAGLATLPDAAVGRYRISGTARATPDVVPAQNFSAGLRVTQAGVVIGNLPSKISNLKVTHNTLPGTVPFVSAKAGKYRFKATGTVGLRGYGERVTVQVRIGGKVFQNDNNRWKIAGQIVGQANVLGTDIVVKAPASGRWFRAL
ncbi:MAG: hypothetical protein R3C45_10435 [Phycisphaerales bacterium]